MEAIQKKIEEVLIYHDQQKNNRLPHLQNNLIRLTNELTTLESPLCSFARYIRLSKIARLKKEKELLEKEIFKLTSIDLIQQFELSVQKQVARMINNQNEIPIQKVFPKTNVIIPCPLKEEIRLDWNQVCNQQALKIMSVDDEEEEKEMLLNPKQITTITNKPINSNENNKDHRDFILNFVELRVPVDMNVVPLQSLQGKLVTTLISSKKRKRTADIQEDQHQKHFCSRCSAPLLFTPNEAKMVCSVCSLVVDYVDSIHNIINLDNETDSSPSAYARPTHLMEIIEPFRPRKHIKIPESVMENILAFIRQDRCGINREITFAKTDSYLKHLGYTDMYKHKYQITMDLNNKYWPRMSEEQERHILFTFIEMQKSFERVKKSKTCFDNDEDGNRISFPKYDLTVFHICRLLGYDEFCPFLKGLQVANRHLKQLRLLKLIFLDMNIAYTPRQR